VQDAVRRCEQFGTQETGAAVLGKIVRLPAPLPDTETRIVTVLSCAVDDNRHEGDAISFKLSVDALAQAAQMAELRGFGESVQCIYHTHGWKPECANCNEDAHCPLAEANPSLQDYQLMESLFPGKATLMPIVGRKLGEPSRHPVMQIHAWRGGQLRPIRWQAYSD
jgi:hypothetical protein